MLGQPFAPVNKTKTKIDGAREQPIDRQQEQLTRIVLMGEQKEEEEQKQSKLIQS